MSAQKTARADVGEKCDARMNTHDGDGQHRCTLQKNHSRLDRHNCICGHKWACR